MSTNDENRRASPEPATVGREYGHVSHSEARDIAGRLIAGAFRRDGERIEDDKRPKFSIPCRPEHDDDCRIVAYIKQQAALLPAAGVPEITHAMMDAGQKYLDSKCLLGSFNLPETFRWFEFWSAMLLAAPSPPSSGWRSIDSAPRDPDLVILAGEKWGTGVLTNLDHYTVSWQPDGEYWEDQETGEEQAPTHWFCVIPPLPSPPAAEEA
jgi:hypothetical protein